METRQLEYFVAVAEELNFTRAAAGLFAVQSTVSAGIRSLESELGVPLFERTHRRVALTPEGERLLPEARAAIEAIDRVRTAVSSDPRGIRGRIRVGIFTNLSFLKLPDLFAEFRRRYPLVDVQLTASPSGSTGLADDVRHGRLDLAFMGLPRTDLAALDVVELTHSPVVAVVPAVHRLAHASRVSLADLADEQFVDSPAGFGNRIAAERAFALAGLHRSVTTVVASLSDIPQFVAGGLGVAVVPLNMFSPAEGAVQIPLDQEIIWTLSIASRMAPSPAAAALRALIIDRLAEPA
jgi:DNA-binding transcriptional LysR family regulator